MRTLEEIGNIKWGSANGQTTLIKDMTIGHLVNVLNWIHEHYKSYSNYSILSAELEEYAKNKAFLLFLDKQPYPLKSNRKWFLYDPKNDKLGIEKPPQEYIDYVKEHYKDTPEFQKYFDRGY